MKLDMHCHVKEGSPDSKVPLDEYITKLKEHGFDGMLITDHDTYKGYRHWKYNMKGKVHEDFVVLKGIEYDTCDGGHILCIMPEGVKMRLLELRGLPVTALIDFVHRHGGILGPAHPCGEKYLSFTNTKKYYKAPEIMKRFDFIEAFNACESEESNECAMKLAKKYKKSVLFICGLCEEKALKALPKNCRLTVACLSDFAKDKQDSMRHAAKYIRQICTSI